MFGEVSISLIDMKVLIHEIKNSRTEGIIPSIQLHI